MNKTIVLGNEVRDVVTGFQGVVIQHLGTLDALPQMFVQPQCVDGKNGVLPECQWLHESRLKYIGEGVKHKEPEAIVLVEAPKITTPENIEPGEEESVAADATGGDGDKSEQTGDLAE